MYLPYNRIIDIKIIQNVLIWSICHVVHAQKQLFSQTLSRAIVTLQMAQENQWRVPLYIKRANVLRFINYPQCVVINKPITHPLYCYHNHLVLDIILMTINCLFSAFRMLYMGLLRPLKWQEPQGILLFLPLSVGLTLNRHSCFYV